MTAVDIPSKSGSALGESRGLIQEIVKCVAGANFVFGGVSRTRLVQHHFQRLAHS